MLWACRCAVSCSFALPSYAVSSSRAWTGSPVSLITQRLCTELHSAERPSKGCCLVLTVMFLPECWTPGPTKPQLKLHKRLVGYKMQMYSIVSGPSFCYLSGHFQKAFLHNIMETQLSRKNNNNNNFSTWSRLSRA